MPDTLLVISTCVILAEHCKHTLASHSVLKLPPQAGLHMSTSCTSCAESFVQGETFMHKHTQPVQIYPKDFHSFHVNASLPDGRKRAPYLSKRKEVSVFVFSWCTSFQYLGLFYLHDECLNQFLQKLLSYNNHDPQHSRYSDKTNPLPPCQGKWVNDWVEIFRSTP